MRAENVVIVFDGLDEVAKLPVDVNPYSMDDNLHANELPGQEGDRK